MPACVSSAIVVDASAGTADSPSVAGCQSVPTAPFFDLAHSHAELGSANKVVGMDLSLILDYF